MVGIWKWSETISQQKKLGIPYQTCDLVRDFSIGLIPELMTIIKLHIVSLKQHICKQVTPKH